MEILAEILEICGKPTAKSRIMHQTDMSNPDFHGAVEQLLRQRLLEFNDQVTKFTTTEKGLEFIRRIKALQELLKS